MEDDGRLVWISGEQLIENIQNDGKGRESGEGEHTNLPYRQRRCQFVEWVENSGKETHIGEQRVEYTEVVRLTKSDAAPSKSSDGCTVLAAELQQFFGDSGTHGR